MKGDRVPDKDNVARFCKPSTVEDGRVQPSAFLLRRNEEALSVNWLEVLRESSRESELAEIREVYSTKLGVRERARIAVLNVGEMRARVLAGTPDNRNLRVLHEPSRNDPSHSEIYDLKEDNELIAELILEVVSEVHPARHPS